MNVVLGLALMVSIGMSLYFWKRGKKIEEQKELEPLDNALVIYLVLLSICSVLIAFIYFDDASFKIENNIGQVGDFIGGLLNPILSFLALLVLLRNSIIQSGESKKTANFLKVQVSIAKQEKFEKTFFELLRLMESFAEVHLRKIDDHGRTMAGELAEQIENESQLYGELSNVRQLEEAKSFIQENLHNDITSNFLERVVRAAYYVSNTKRSRKSRRAYMRILSNCLYPDERILIAHLSIRHKNVRKLFKEWKIIRIKPGYYLCPLIEQYYVNKVL